MKIKKDDIPKKKSGPDRQLALTPQNDTPVKKKTGRTAPRKKAEKLVSVSPTGIGEKLKKDNKALLNELSVLKAELDIQNENLKNALLELETSRDKYRRLYNTTPVAYLTLDKNATVISANAASSELFGAGQRGMAGHAFSSLVGPGAQDTFRLAMSKVLDTGEKQSSEIAMVKMDGNVFSAYVEIAGIADPGSVIDTVRAIVVDITERKRVEEALRESEERYRLLFENTSDGIYLIDRNYRVTAISPNMGKMLGYSTEEMAGKNLTELDFVAPESLQSAVSNVKRVLSGETIPTAEYQFIAKDGTMRYQDISGAPLVRDGKIVAAVCVARDITERKKAEEALQQSEEHYRLLFENTSDGIYIVDRDFNFTPLTPNIGKMLGYSPVEMQGKKLQDLAIFTPESLQLAVSNLQRVLAGEAIPTADCQFIARDGTYGYWDVGAAPLVSDGKIIAAICVARDITKRKEAEQALQKSEEKYRTLIENASEGITIIREDGSFALFNARFLAMSGYDAGELRSSRFIEFIFPDDRSSIYNSYLRRVKGEQSEGADTYRFVHKSGEIKWMEVNFTLIEWEGKPATLNFQTDVTERKKADEALQQSELRFRLLFDNMLHGMAYCRMIFENGQPRDYIYLEVNSAFERLTGLKDVEGKKVSEVIPGLTEAHPEMLRMLGKVLLSGKPRHFESFTEQLGIWFSVTVYSPARDHFVIVFDNITERKKADEALRQERDWGKELLDVAGVMILAISIEGKVLLANAKACEILECGMDDIVGKDWVTTFIPERIRDEIRSALTHFGSGDGQPVENYENPVLTAAGQEKIIAWHNRAIKDEKGLISGLLSSGEDITKRKKAERALIQSSERYRDLFENSGSAIVIVDENGRYLMANKKASESYGITPEEFARRSIYDFLPREMADRYMKSNRRLLSTGKQRQYEDTMKLPAGDRTFLFIDTCLKDENGRYFAIQSSGTDITERKSAEENLIASNAALKKSLDDAVTTMAKIVEIRDPYTAGHQRRVAQLCAAMAAEMGLDDALIGRLRMAAIVHDIGKIYVPAEILSKPGKLSVIEFGIIKIHSEKGHEIVKNIDLPPHVALAILQHHERMDGSGYPGGLVGQNICIEARILAVADVVEAMSSHRPYRPAKGIKDAIEEILKNRGTLYDTDVVDACVKLFMEKGFQFED